MIRVQSQFNSSLRGGKKKVFFSCELESSRWKMWVKNSFVRIDESRDFLFYVHSRLETRQFFFYSTYDNINASKCGG